MNKLLSHASKGNLEKFKSLMTKALNIKYDLMKDKLKKDVGASYSSNVGK